MTQQPYTDADLRAEAARQLGALTEDPEFMGVGEQMNGADISSRGPEEDEEGRIDPDSRRVEVGRAPRRGPVQRRPAEDPQPDHRRG